MARKKNCVYVSMVYTPTHTHTLWAIKLSIKTKLPENRITYRQYLGEMPSTFLVPYLLDIRTHQSHVLAKILFAMSNSPNHRIVSPVGKMSKQIKKIKVFRFYLENEIPARIQCSATVQTLHMKNQCFCTIGMLYSNVFTSVQYAIISV